MLTIDHLKPYQHTAIQFILDNPYCALWLDMGLGKTVSSLTATLRLLLTCEVNKILIIAPLRVALNTWPEELNNWEHLKDELTFNQLAGCNVKQRSFRTTCVHADIHIVNREMVPWLVEVWGREWPYDMVIIDEASSFKNSQSKRFKALKKVRHKIRRLVELTGTPAENGLMDLYAQMFLLDQGQRLGRTLTKYRQTYFDKDYLGFNYTIKDGAKNKIHNRVSDICLSMSSEDYLTLPERIYNTIPVTMPPKLTKQYEKLERDFLLELEAKEVVANNAGVLTNKLLQFANGALYNEDRDVLSVHDLKLEVLDSIIEESAGEPILLAYNYEFDRDRILERYPQAKVLDNDPKTKQAWDQGRIPLLITHPASAAFGLNLQKGGCITVWYGLNWSLGLYKQFNKRLHRSGQNRPVTIHHIVCKGTVDETVLMALKGKDLTQQALLDAVKADIKRRI